MDKTLKQKILEDQTKALKSKDHERLSTLRMLVAAIKNKEIELQKKDLGLSDQEVLIMVGSEAKKRKDAAAEYQNGSRPDLALKEETELKILQEYLPPELSEEEIVRIVKTGISEAGAKSSKDFGIAMKTIMPYLKGKASGERIATILKAELEKIAA